MPPVHNAIRQVSHARASSTSSASSRSRRCSGFSSRLRSRLPRKRATTRRATRAEGRVWIVRRTRLERLAPVGGGDALRIATNVEDFRRARSLRRYEVERTSRFREATQTSRPAALATTDWVYSDAASGRPVSVPDEMKSALFGEAAPVLARASRVELPAAGEPCRLRIPVRPSHLDHMGHVNNAVWADFLEDGAFELFGEAGFGLDRMVQGGGALRVRRLDLEYLDEARVGQDLCILSWLEDEDGGTDEAPPRDAHASSRESTTATESASSGPRASGSGARRPEILGGAPPE